MGIKIYGVLAVWGFRWSRKSQLIITHIYEYRHDYPIVFWIEAGYKESIERDCEQIYRLIYNLQIRALQEILRAEATLPAVKDWFYGREGR